MPNHRFGRRPQARVELKLVPADYPDTYTVYAITRAALWREGDSEWERFRGGGSPIGTVKKGESGAWLHSAGHNPRPIYGRSKTKEKAAQECYRSHRAWIGF